MKLEFSRQILEKYLNIKYENPFSESRDVPFGQKDQRTDLTKLIVAFRNIAGAPNNHTKHMNKLIGKKFSCRC